MERRDAVRSIALGVWGLVFLPGCDSGDVKNEEEKGVFLPIDDIQAKNLEAVVDTFLPATTTKGAVELQVHHFINRLIANCYDEPYIKEFIGYLDLVDLRAKRVDGGDFFTKGQQERELILTKMGEEEASEEQKAYRELKEYCILGFTTSEYYLTQFTSYDMAPGQYEGCIPVPSGDILI